MGNQENTECQPPVFDRNTIEQFMFFGFVPKVDKVNPFRILGDWSPDVTCRQHMETESTLVRRGIRAWQAAIEDYAGRPGPPGQQVVFLSGGLDSRAILGGLLQHFESSEIVAATFGQPGEQDYDFAQQIAKSAHVRHETLETFSVDWTTEELVNSVLARTVPLPFVFGQRYSSYCLHRRIGKDNAFWDGLMGGSVSGQLLPRRGDNQDWNAALAHFVVRNKVQRAECLVTSGFQPTAWLPQAPLKSMEYLPYNDQLDVALRQTCYIQTRLMREYVTRTPFVSKHWVNFMLALPVEHRTNQYLYKEIVKEAFPKLFSLPGTTLGGLPVTASRWNHRRWTLERKVVRRVPAVKHILPSGGALVAPQSANQAIRGGMVRIAAIRSLFEQNIHDLHARGAIDWLDVRPLWERHVAGLAQNEPLLNVLLALEINLKAANRSVESPATA